MEAAYCIGGSKGGGRQGRAPPLGVQILSFSCSFRQKNWKIIVLLGVGASPPGENPGSTTVLVTSNAWWDRSHDSPRQTPPGQTPSWADTPPSRPPLGRPPTPSWSMRYLSSLQSRTETVKGGRYASYCNAVLVFCRFKCKVKKGIVFKFRVKNIYSTCVHGLYKCIRSTALPQTGMCEMSFVSKGSCVFTFWFCVYLHSCFTSARKVNAVADLKGGCKGLPFFQLFNFMQFWQKSCQTIG